MIGTYEIRCHAAKPQMPLSPMFAFKDSPSSLRLLEIPKKIGNWNITTVKVAVNYPDNTSTTYTASRNGNVWVVTFNGCSITGKVANGLEILADGTDENGDAVNGYVLGVGDIYILDRDADIEEAVSKHIMKYCDETPETPVAGDVVVETGTLKIYDGTQWISIDIDLSEYATKSEVETTASTLDSKIDSTKTELESSIAEVASDIPTTTSELTNDSGFITSASVPTKTSDLTNDSDFITSTQVTPANNPVGYAKYAFFSGYLMMKTSSTGFDGNSQVSLLPTENGKGAAVIATLPSCVSWFLSEYNGTTYNPPIELKFGYCDSVYTIVTIGGSDRKTFTNVKSFAWFAQGEREGYVIKIVPSGNTFLPDAKLRIGRLEHPVTYNTAKTSIETIDGQSEMIVCTRANTITTYTDYELAYKDELPTKVSDLTNDAGYLTTVSWNDVQGKPTNVSDFTNDAGYVTASAVAADYYNKVEVSAFLSTKQDELDTDELSMISQVTDERKTVITFTDNTSEEYEWSGEITRQNIVDAGLWNVDHGGWIKEPLSIKVGTAVTSLGNYAFTNAHYLTSIDIPSTVTNIGQYCLYDCSALTGITIPYSMKVIGSDTFGRCASLTSVTIPNSVESIGAAAFEQCTSLSTLLIPDSVTSIGYRAFSGCTNLTSVTIPDSVTSIGNYAFSGCSGLTSVTIPSGVTSIGDYAFYGCSGLTSVAIPDSVTSIGYGAFEGCSGLTSVAIPDSVTSIGYGAFLGCTNVTSLTAPFVPSGLDASRLTMVTIPSGVTSIGDLAFSGCSGLTSVTIPDSVTSIGYGAFEGCSGLTSVTIPDSVTSIGDYAFYNCSGLTSVVFRGKTLTQVQGMTNYPWGISNTNIIKTWNTASQEWVLEQIAALRAELQGGN